MKSWKKLLSAVLAASLVLTSISIPAEVQAAEVNLALNGTATASSYEPGTNFDATKTNDGDTSLQSRWGTDANAAVNEWLQVDLGSAKTINHIVIHFEREDAAQNILGYHVDIDGQTVYTKSEKAAQVETITFETAKEGQVVKLVIDAADGGTLNYVNVGVKEFEIYGEADGTINPPAIEGPLTNLALGKTAEANDSEASTLGADKAVDGDTSSKSSRWASAENAGPHWVAVNLGKVETISSVRIFWEMRKATSYRIQISNDGTIYSDVKVIPNRPADREDVIVFDSPLQAQYVRLYIDSFTAEDPDGGVTWNTVSIYEMEVYNGIFEKPVSPIDEITVELPENGDKLIVNIPESEDFDLKYNGTDYEQVIGEDLTIYTPIVDTTVKVSFKSTNKADATDYEFKEIELTVPGLYEQEEGDNEAPVVLPELREWKGYTGNFIVAENAKVVIASEELRPMAEAFVADYEDLTGEEMEIAVGEVGDVKAGEFFFELITVDKGLDEEGYLMEIKDIVTVQAEDATGAFWATRTILQALKSGDMTTIPQGITRDYPLYKVRGFILDVGRKTFTMDYLQQVVKQMSWYKLNDFHVHLNDNYIFLENYTSAGKDPMTAYSGFRLESKIKAGDTITLNGREFTYSADLTNTDVFYGKDEFRDFIDESNVYGVNIVPEFDAPAHSLAFTKILPELRTGTNGRQNDHLDLKNQYEECYDFITNVFDEYLLGEDGKAPVFSEDTVVHIGADEYEADGDAFRKFCNDMVDYVENTGRKARIWGSLTSIKGTLVNGEPSVKVDGTGVQMNLWNYGWANMDAMYELGFELIDCNDGQYYIVPNAGYYGEYLGESVMYNDAPNSIGNVTIPAGDKQMIGAAYAVWNDMIDMRDNGISEYDVYKRLANNMGLFAAKMWGKGSLSMKDAQKIEKFMGDAPNTDFHYAVEADKKGNVLNWEIDDLKEMGGVNAGFITDGEEEVVSLVGGESYLETGAGTLGLDNELTVKVKRTSDSTADQILFESAYGSIKAVQGTTGKVGITRENRDYSFAYVLPVDEWVELTIKNEFEVVSLYVNGELVDVLGDGETVEGRPLLATCMLPVERIGSKTNAFEGYVASVSVIREPERDYYEGKVTVNASSEETVNENGAAANVVDGDESSIWHSNYSGTAVTPHWIELVLEEVTEMDAFVYVPRSGGGTNGIVTEYVLKISTDGVNYEEVSSGTWAENSSEKTVEFREPLKAKNIRLEIVDSVGGFASAAEMKVRLPIVEEPETPEVNKHNFTDVKDTAWYADEVQYVFENEIMTGTSETTFEPAKKVSRAVIVTTLYKLAGSPVVDESFDPTTVVNDYKANTWWSDALKWALSVGVATGNTSTNKFEPSKQVTRQELATFLERYSRLVDGKTVVISDETAALVESLNVPKWAKAGFAFALETGIITGITNGASVDYAPKGTTSRAQLATMLYRYCELNK